MKNDPLSQNDGRVPGYRGNAVPWGLRGGGGNMEGMKMDDKTAEKIAQDLAITMGNAIRNTVVEHIRKTGQVPFGCTAYWEGSPYAGSLVVSIVRKDEVYSNSDREA